MTDLAFFVAGGVAALIGGGVAFGAYTAFIMVVIVRCDECGRIGVRFGFDRQPVWWLCRRCR